MRFPGKITRFWLSLGLALSLSACLTSDAPKLYRSDLIQPPGLAGGYIATMVPPPQNSDEASSVDAKLDARDDGSYLLTLIEKDHIDSPVEVRLLALRPGIFLGVMTEADSHGDSMYALVSKKGDKGWSFRIVDLRPDSRKDALQPVMKRHGAESITFEDLGADPTTTHDQIHGSLDAGQLRMLFNDPDFTKALQTDSGFELTPK